jgi:hypothetical protein
VSSFTLRTAAGDFTVVGRLQRHADPAGRLLQRREAIGASDRNPRARVDPSFADLRAFLLARLIDAGPAA